MQTKVITNPVTGTKTGVYTTVIDPNSPMRGMTYPVNAVRNGYELNALDRMSELAYVQRQVTAAQEIAANAPRLRWAA
ncbi:MAG: hypothetical protein U5N55_13675 [Cypionkella sp.]|nr:hypothetical protein [Cypionkella sp.]